jgi:hypothetical protein
MYEEYNDPEQVSTEETETSAEGYSEENNTSSDSEVENTQRTGRTAQDRIRELVAENKKLKSQTADKQSSPEPQGDKILNAKVDLLYKAPDHLKAQADEIASYAARYGVPVEDAIAIFDSKSKVSEADVKAAQAAQSEAMQSRTGGTANPAARQETTDIKNLSDDELKALAEQAFRGN